MSQARLNGTNEEGLFTFGYSGLHWFSEICSQTHSPPATVIVENWGRTLSSAALRRRREDYDRLLKLTLHLGNLGFGSIWLGSKNTTFSQSSLR